MNALDTAQSWPFIANWLQAGSINIFGRPLAGKDTQAERLAHHLNGTVLSGGQILREAAESIPAHAYEQMTSGKLFPTEDYIRIVTPFLSKPEFADRPLILSSVGRWHGEEPGVLDAAALSGHQLQAVIFLDLDEATRHQRLIALQHLNDRGSREDDLIEKQQIREEEFRQKTLPVLQFYRERGLLLDVDAAGTRDEVEARILDALVSFAKKKAA